MILNLFFEDKDDRWFPGDRHIRQAFRRVLFGKPRINGQLRVFLNLCAGLDRLGIDYRVNDYRHIQKHPDELACIIGRAFVLDWMKWRNPILPRATPNARMICSSIRPCPPPTTMRP